MPPNEALSEGEVQDILDEYADQGSYRAVSKELGHSTSTVSKYVKSAVRETHDDLGSVPETAEALGFDEEMVRRVVEPDDGGEVERSPPDRESERSPPPEPKSNPSNTWAGQAEPDFATMDHADFIRWFFSQKGFQVNDEFLERVVSMVNVRGQLPDSQEMRRMLRDSSTGIGNDSDAGMVADAYWTAALRFFSAQKNQNAQREGGGQGQWFGQDSGGGQPPGGRADEPAWVDAPPTFDEAPAPQRRGSAPSGGGERGGQANPGGVDPALAEAIRDLKQTQQQLVQRLTSQQRTDQEQRSMKEQVQEMVELQNSLEALRGQGGNNEQLVADLRKQIQDLQQQVAAGGEPQGINVSGDEGLAAMVQLAANGDIDPETLSVLADSMGVTDPEVKKAEYDLKKTETKMENRKELVDKVFDGMGEASGSLLGTLLDSLGGGGEGGGEEPETQDRSQQAGEVRVAEKPPSQRGRGGMTEGYAEPGGAAGQRQTEPDDSGMSPARRRYAEEVEGNQDAAGGRRSEPAGEPSGATEGFRSPGGSEQPGAETTRCQWVGEDGSQCPEDAEPGEAFCPEHLKGIGGT